MRKESDASYVRVFIAVPVSKEIKESISNAAEMLKANISGGVKWVAPRNYHLTMAFIGNTDPERIRDIENVLETVKYRRFTMNFGGVGVFPSPAKARVLWMGIRTGSDVLTKISADITSGLIKSGFQIDGKPFSPHLTIARFRVPQKIEKKAFELRAEAGEMTADRIILYKSELNPSGPVYSEIFMKSLDTI